MCSSDLPPASPPVAVYCGPVYRDPAPRSSPRSGPAPRSVSFQGNSRICHGFCIELVGNTRVSDRLGDTTGIALVIQRPGNTHQPCKWHMPLFSKTRMLSKPSLPGLRVGAGLLLSRGWGLTMPKVTVSSCFVDWHLYLTKIFSQNDALCRTAL